MPSWLPKIILIFFGYSPADTPQPSVGRGLSVIDWRVHFERVETLGRFGAELALEDLTRVLVQVADVRLQYVGTGEGLPAEQAGQACNRDGKKIHETL